MKVERENKDQRRKTVSDNVMEVDRGQVARTYFARGIVLRARKTDIERKVPGLWEREGERLGHGFRLPRIVKRSS